jgi:hypothetical protein
MWLIDAYVVKVMSVSIRVDDELYEAARHTAKAECRTIANQIEFWAKVGKAALENPDLPVEFVRDLLLAKAQDRALADPFQFEGERD